MSEKKEFENILAALGERPLTEQEQMRLWELIELKPERLEEYLEVQQMNFALEDMNLSLVTAEDEVAKVEKSKKSFTGIILAVAAAVVLGFVLFGIDRTPEKVEIAEVVVPETIHNAESESTLEEEYRKKIEELPTTGSLNRPPTEFSSVQAEDDQIDFNRDIRPIIAENCISCHGPDEHGREADLRLDTHEGILADNTVVPGKPEESEFITRIFTDDEDDLMPPPDSHKSLTQEQKELLKKWVKAGAPWQNHWSYVKPVKPQVKGDENPVDFFISKRLKRKGLSLSPEADRYSLARRAAFDITGMPPEPQLLSSYIFDQEEGAYERYIDKLFASPHYGEHMARFWLDAARYSDTHGMHLDNYREIWPYRDWVINAFNNNMPFDQFTIEQLAGDLLPNPTQSQLIATGFNRCNATTSEGGSIAEELEVRYMTDRVETTSMVFLGMTTGCAACHDHKFDPISQREFYQMGAFFNNTTQPAMDGNQKDTPPVLTMPKDEYKKEWNTLLTQRTAAWQKLEKPISKAAVPKWWDSSKENKLASINISEGLIVEALAEENALVYGQQTPVVIPEENKVDPLHPSGKPAGVLFVKKGGVKVDGEFEVSSDKPFSVSMWLRTPDEVRESSLVEISGGKNSLKVNLSYQGNISVGLNFPNGKLSSRIGGDMALKPRSWQHVAVLYSGGQAKTSISIYVDGEKKDLRIASEQYIKKNQFTGKMFLGKNFETGGLSHVRFYNRMLSENEIKLQASEFDLNRLLTSSKAYEWKELTEKKRNDLKLIYKVKVDQDSINAEKILGKTQTRRDFIYARSTTSLIMEEKSNSMPTAWVLDRGEYDKKKEKVTAGVPKVFPEIEAGLPKNRLGLAKWIVSRENPLTSRVTVNRFWQNIFGTGLVETAEDFGIMGTQPTHPKLLDWLALEFIDSGWNVRHMLRLMVTSNTYKQAAMANSELLEKDPVNKLLSRGPRMRLDAEEIRDQALLVSGLLKTEIGGPGVKPYQPAGLWKVVAFAGSNTKNFKADKGEKLYRRSVYTFWKRTSPPPAMAAFDAPTREGCTVRRERTNTPMQALVLMNDPQFFEAARYLAQRSLKERSVELDRVRWLFQEVLGRPPVDADVEDLSMALKDFKQHFFNDPEGAAALVKTGDSTVDETLNVSELAAWTMVVNILMNRDDFINN
ncbi:MAG: DUF1553 domain-containing protein [Lentisphaerales bacterium]|nr:DUF1553 domain-containing protein [Lentisphaerales bacterium]